MSVVVIGMEMLRACIDGLYYGNCPMDRLWCAQRFAPEGRSQADIFRDRKDKVPDWCPLRPLPDGYGRLIDADAFEKFVQDKWEQNEISNGGWISFREWLRDQETILEAEGGIDE